MQRYDRQLRLWTANGQENLANAHIWAIGKSLAMMECLKNLALSGVNRFTLTMSKHPSNTFFDTIEFSFEHQLKKLNPDLVVIYGVPEVEASLVLRVQDVNYPHLETSVSKSVPCISIESEMLNGSIRLALSVAFPVLLPHPAAGLSTVGISTWPEYKRFCDSFNLDEVDEVAFRHIPWCVLLSKAQGLAGDGGLPAIKEKLRQMRRYGDEDNFDEALKNVYKTKHELIPDGIRDLIGALNHPSVKTNEPFWCLVKALSKFVSIHGTLPVSDEVPDMVCDTKSYVMLKKLFKSKAEKDTCEVESLYDEENPSENQKVSREYIKLFCANSRFLQALIPNSESLTDPTIGTIPSSEATALTDSQALIDSKSVMPAEIAPVSALVGGIAAQEAQKILMKQYTPLTDKLVYDGLTQSTSYVKGNINIINK